MKQHLSFLGSVPLCTPQENQWGGGLDLGFHNMELIGKKVVFVELF